MESGGALFYLGPLGIGVTVVTTWGIMLVLGLFSALATRRLSDDPGMLHSALEGAVLALEAAIAAVFPQRPRMAGRATGKSPGWQPG